MEPNDIMLGRDAADAMHVLGINGMADRRRAASLPTAKHTLRGRGRGTTVYITPSAQEWMTNDVDRVLNVLEAMGARIVPMDSELL